MLWCCYIRREADFGFAEEGRSSEIVHLQTYRIPKPNRITLSLGLRGQVDDWPANFGALDPRVRDPEDDEREAITTESCYRIEQTNRQVQG